MLRCKDPEVSRHSPFNVSCRWEYSLLVAQRSVLQPFWKISAAQTGCDVKMLYGTGSSSKWLTLNEAVPAMVEYPMIALCALHGLYVAQSELSDMLVGIARIVEVIVGPTPPASREHTALGSRCSEAAGPTHCMRLMRTLKPC